MRRCAVQLAVTSSKRIKVELGLAEDAFVHSRAVDSEPSELSSAEGTNEASQNGGSSSCESAVKQEAECQAGG